MAIKENRENINRVSFSIKEEKSIRVELLYFHADAYRKILSNFMCSRGMLNMICISSSSYVYISECLRVTRLLFFLLRRSHFHVRNVRIPFSVGA